MGKNVIVMRETHKEDLYEFGKTKYNFDFYKEFRIWKYSHRFYMKKRDFNTIKESEYCNILDQKAWFAYFCAKYKDCDMGELSELKDFFEYIKNFKSKDVSFFKQYLFWALSVLGTILISNYLCDEVLKSIDWEEVIKDILVLVIPVFSILIILMIAVCFLYNKYMNICIKTDFFNECTIATARKKLCK